ncbi:hypothetical protein ACFX1T_038282 [Malus domestica]
MEGSRQFINLEKSLVHFSSGCPQSLKTQISKLLGIKHMEGFRRYLGIQADFGGSKKRVFEAVRNKLDERINRWAEQFLSMAGNELAKEIEQVIVRLWWQDQKTKKGVHWLAWNKVSKRKSIGGLGFKETISFNLAMLAKVGWRLICNPNSHLARVLRAKYFPTSSFIDALVGRGTSWGRKGILQGRKVLKLGIRWRVGDGRSIRVMKDPWLPTPRTFLPISRHDEMPGRVEDPIAPGVRMNLLRRGVQLETKCPHCDDAFKTLERFLRWVVCGLWRIWKCGNRVVFDKIVVDPREAVELFRQHWSDIELAAGEGGQKACRHDLQVRGVGGSWSKPPFGMIKVNCDGAWCSRTGNGGFG